MSWPQLWFNSRLLCVSHMQLPCGVCVHDPERRQIHVRCGSPETAEKTASRETRGQNFVNQKVEFGSNRFTLQKNNDELRFIHGCVHFFTT